jgi:hypothetical protein
VKKVYPQFSLSKNVIENNFYPGNPSVHAQITIPKAAFFFERAREFRFYGEVSVCASKLTDAFDKERIAVALALGCDVPHAFDYFRRAYEYTGDNLYEIFGGGTCEHAKRWGTMPATEGCFEKTSAISSSPWSSWLNSWELRYL